MQNVRSKSITYAAPGGLGRGGWPAAAGAGGCAVAAGPALRWVPGRVALFAVVLCAVGAMLVPRLAQQVSAVAEQPRVHVVAGGDTLWGVARHNAGGQDPREYVHRLMQQNNLATPQIVPGQELRLP